MSQPTRVLQIANMNRSSGVASFVMNYYRNINRDKLQFDFIVSDLDEENYVDEIQQLGGRVYILPSYKKVRTYWRAISQILADNRYSIIHAHESVVSLLALWNAKRFEVPVRIAHSHNPSMTSRWKNKVVVMCRPLFRSVCTHFFACSKAAGTFLYGKNKKDAVIVIPNAIHTDLYCFDHKKRDFIRTQLGIQDKFVVGHIGRFNIQKNHQFLIDIFYEVDQREKESVMLLIGAGEEEKKIKDKVTALGLEGSVQFLGVRTDIPDLLQAMDVFVLPSLFEGLPVVGIEAQAAGLPCVFSRAITAEVDITKNNIFISLNDNINTWVEGLLSFKNFKRVIEFDAIVDAGYDIHNESLKLQDFYLGFGTINNK